MPPFRPSSGANFAAPTADKDLFVVVGECPKLPVGVGAGRGKLTCRGPYLPQVLLGLNCKDFLSREFFIFQEDHTDGQKIVLCKQVVTALVCQRRRTQFFIPGRDVRDHPSKLVGH